MALWKERLEDLLNKKGMHIGYTEIGNHLIDPLIKTHFKDAGLHVFKGADTMYPVFWSESADEYIERPFEHHRQIHRSFQPLIVLVQAVYRALEKFSFHQILQGEMPITYFINLAYEHAALVNYDFVEIGTSSFNTIVEEATDDMKGICVEPIKHYLDQLPERPEVEKVNCAITAGRSQDFIDLYYLPPEYIEKNALPRWFKGCNSIGHMHPLHIKYGLQHAVERIAVPVMNIDEFFILYRIGKVGHLKIDTEGHDLVIMDGLLYWLESLPKAYLPGQITFESNELYSPAHVQERIDKAAILGYTMIETGWNTILELN